MVEWPANVCSSTLSACVLVACWNYIFEGERHPSPTVACTIFVFVLYILVVMIDSKRSISEVGSEMSELNHCFRLYNSLNLEEWIVVEDRLPISSF